MTRSKKTVKLSQSGNLVVKSRVPEEVLQGEKFTSTEEFATMRYTAATCDPDDYAAKGFNLRASNYRRTTEIFVVVTMYNEDVDLFNRTMFALAENIRHLSFVGAHGWDLNAWKKVVVCIVSDGRSKVNPDVLRALEVMGVYQDGLAQASINSEPVEGHIYEYTTQKFYDQNLNLWGGADGMVPMQTIFCLKEKNAKKINSHRWFFNFAEIIQPRVCVLIDVGTKPSSSSLYHLWESFYRNEQIAGACGEIRADMGRGLTYLNNLLNPLVASQNFEYKISNLMDKSLESVFGYISVLPGAFSAYRFKALGSPKDSHGPLARYFEGEQRKGQTSHKSAFYANLYLAEDRILCFELIASRNARWILHYESRAYARTDVPDNVPEFLSQRRRWLNGSLFAAFYAFGNLAQIWRTRHNVLRKLVFTIQYLYNMANQVFSWFILGNFAATFFFLFSELKEVMNPDKLSSTMSSKIINTLLTAAEISYPVALVCLFLISFGNRPQAFGAFYTIVMIILGLVGVVMIILLFSRAVEIFSVNVSTLSSDYFNLLSDAAMLSNTPSNDTMSFMMNTVMWQVVDIMHTNLQKNLTLSITLRITYIMTLVSTYGVMFLASLLQFDIAHMFTCIIQYTLLLPSYINVLTIYALANTHDVSWGTKGETNAEILPQVAAVKQKDGSVVAKVNVAADHNDISAHYEQSKQQLMQSMRDAKPMESKFKPNQEDEYRGFRTKLLLWYLVTNTALFILAVSLTNTDMYMIILLSSICVIQSIKIIGVLCFVVGNIYKEIRRCFGRGRRSGAVGAGTIDAQNDYRLSRLDRRGSDASIGSQASSSTILAQG
ncbi:chitin synthase [Zopfochytrium polystomum]|nr:chitin synthase [Zopfochytrium polystomum]